VCGEKTETNKPRRILFVCSGNEHRSRAAQELLIGIEGLEVRSAGILPLSPTLVSKQLINWANTVFVMEKPHKDVILQISPEAESKIVVLDIPDDYQSRNDPELIEKLKDRLFPYFGRI
jgi:predicted protein tyrosine phosphatase